MLSRRIQQCVAKFKILMITEQTKNKKGKSNIMFWILKYSEDSVFSTAGESQAGAVVVVTECNQLDIPMMGSVCDDQVEPGYAT